MLLTTVVILTLTVSLVPVWFPDRLYNIQAVISRMMMMNAPAPEPPMTGVQSEILKLVSFGASTVLKIHSSSDISTILSVREYDHSSWFNLNVFFIASHYVQVSTRDEFGFDSAHNGQGYIGCVADVPLLCYHFGPVIFASLSDGEIC